jgi:class 3 adenylate cyclase
MITAQEDIGLTVSKGARITADGGQIIASGVVVELAGQDTFRFGSPFQAELKGLDGTHQLYPVLWNEDLPGNVALTRIASSVAAIWRSPCCA